MAKTTASINEDLGTLTVTMPVRLGGALQGIFKGFFEAFEEGLMGEDFYWENLETDNMALLRDLNKSIASEFERLGEELKRLRGGE